MMKQEKITKTRSLRLMNMHIPSHMLLTVWCLIVIVPLWVMIINSFKDMKSIYLNPFGFSPNMSAANYVRIFKDASFLRYFANSFIAVASSLVLVMVVGTLAAYAFANWRGKIATAVFYFCIAGMMLPIKIASIRLLLLMRSIGLFNTVWALVPIYTAMGVPIAIFVLTEFIRQIPGELVEAGLIDGAGRLHILVRIITPLLRPAVATVAIYNLIPFWNDLWFPLLMIVEDNQKTLMLGVTKMFGQYQTDWARVLAVLTLSALPVIALYLTMSQQFIKGLTAGAVKG